MTGALEVVGLAALVVAGFMLDLWIGFAVLGAACLMLAHAQALRARDSAARELARRGLVPGDVGVRARI